MSEYVESESGVSSGGPLAWRLFTALEGGALLVAVLGLLIQAVRPRKSACTERSQVNESTRTLHILLSDEKSSRGRILAEKLRSSGYRVSSLAATTDADDQADALVVFGTHPEHGGLDGLAHIVSNDLYNNMSAVEKVRECVRPGGRVVWVAGGTPPGSFAASVHALEDVLRAHLQRIADDAKCEVVWVEHGDSASLTTRVLTAILTSTSRCSRNQQHAFDLRSATARVSLILWRWFKSLA